MRTPEGEVMTPVEGRAKETPERAKRRLQQSVEQRRLQRVK
jgi:hypothetical protein